MAAPGSRFRDFHDFPTLIPGSDYELLRVLGRGGFATVYECKKVGTDQRFAAKAMDIRTLKNPLKMGLDQERLERLQGEAKLQSKVQHKNLIRFIDYIEDFDGEWMFIILELASGGSLVDFFSKRTEPLPEKQVLNIFCQLVDGLNHLHIHNIIHRDLKLENVLIVPEGSSTSQGEFIVKIADFGLSINAGPQMNGVNSVVGSPSYVAPEVLSTRPYDHRADLWSLGVVLFVMLANRFPFGQDKRAAAENQTNIDAAIGSLHRSEDCKAVLFGLLRLSSEGRTSLALLSTYPWMVQDCGSSKRQRIICVDSESSRGDEPNVMSPGAKRRSQSSRGDAPTVAVFQRDDDEIRRLFAPHHGDEPKVARVQRDDGTRDTRLRAKPDLKRTNEVYTHPKRCVRNGELVTILRSTEGTSGGWCWVRSADGNEGFLNRKYLTEVPASTPLRTLQKEATNDSRCSGKKPRGR